MSGTVDASVRRNESFELEPLRLFITWTTYGTWLPGDRRGWRKTVGGPQSPQPMLADWCRDRLSEEPVVLTSSQRAQVEQACREHARIRGWELHVVSARSTHVHLAVIADAPPKKVRDQFKANATRALRELPNPIKNKKVWTKGGDIEVVETDEEFERVIVYIRDAQDRMDRGK